MQLPALEVLLMQEAKSSIFIDTYFTVQEMCEKYAKLQNLFSFESHSQTAS